MYAFPPLDKNNAAQAKPKRRLNDTRNYTTGGATGARTPDPLLAKQVLSQLSYRPTVISNVAMNN